MSKKHRSTHRVVTRYIARCVAHGAQHILQFQQVTERYSLASDRLCERLHSAWQTQTYNDAGAAMQRYTLLNAFRVVRFAHVSRGLFILTSKPV